LTNVNGTLFFAANDGNQGEVLWKSDGTAAGTKVVSTAMSDPGGLTNVNGTLFFRASDPQHGDELWKSDGTRSGTVLVQDINPGSAGSNPASLTVSGGHLFFSADDGVHGTELWDPPILPAPGSATIQTPDGLSSSGDNPPLSPLLDEADVAVAVLSMAGRP